MRHIFGILVFLPMLSMAQENLVPNPSFEEYTECPTGWTFDWSRVVGWENGNASTPDFYHICGLTLPSGTPVAGVPNNVHGSQSPLSGDAYMGLYGVQMGNQEWREYIQAELTEPLHHRIRYKVSFHVCLSEKSNYAISTLGAHLSENAISSNDLLVLDAEPQILSAPLQPITDTANWILVTDTFRSPHGGERFITIGNFFSDAESDTVFVNPDAPLGNGRAYYYIDDVSVVALDSVPDGIEETERLAFSVYPNPAAQEVRIASQGPLSQVRLLDVHGREVIRREVSGHAYTINLRGIPTGLYLIEVQDTEGRRLVERLVKTEGP